MSSGSNPAKPRLACEIAADRVLVGRLAEDGRSLESSAARELAPGSVIPDLVEGNLRQRDAVKEAVASALGQCGRALTRCDCGGAGRGSARGAAGI